METNSSNAIGGLREGSIVTRGAKLAGPGGVPVQYSHVVRSWSSRELIKLEPPGDPFSFVVTFPAQDLANNLWCDGKHFVRRPVPPGSFAFYDFSREWIVQVPNPIDSFHLWLPKEAFRELEKAHGVSIVDNLHLDPTEHCRDEVMLHLAASLIPSLSAPHEVNKLYVDHVFEAIRMHIAQTYGDLSPRAAIHRGALTPLQVRRVKERILSDLANDPSLSELASICRLSVGHFARAFRDGTGMPPHRWLVAQRVEEAQRLLAGGNMPLSEIAQACGFADQSHFTRVFSKATGASPGAWRRQRRN